MGSFSPRAARLPHVRRHHPAFEDAWKVRIDPNPARAFPNMFEAALDGSFKGIYIQGVAHRPVRPQHPARGSRHGTDGMRGGRTCSSTRPPKWAHVFLPGSSFLEKDGTLTNAERRISRVRRVMPPLTGKGRLGDHPGPPRPWAIRCTTPTRPEIMDEIARLTPSFHGVSYDLLEVKKGSDPVAVQRDCAGRHADHARGGLHPW